MAIGTRRLRNGKTAYDVELRRPDGTKYSKTFYTRRNAQTWEAEQRADRARDRWVDPTAGRIRLREYADEWMRTRRLAPRTREVYASQLKHIAATFGDVPLHAITRRAVRAWYADLSERVSPLQAAKCYRQLMAMLNTAAEDDLIAKNRSRVRGAASETSDERPLIPVSQALALVEAIDPPYGALLLLAASCGLRLGELLGLTRGDLDFLHRRVIVNKQRQELSSGIEVRRPKTAAGVRDLAVPESIVPFLEAHLGRYVGPSPDAPLFAGPKGGVRRASFYKAWHKALAETGVRPDLKPHDLRHLANTLAAKVPGTTLKDLMARLGQTSPHAALRYLHRTAQADRAMAQGIDDELRQAIASAERAPDDEANAR
jgi:integrase